MGCAAAYYLAKKGRQALVIEKDPGVGLQASGRNGGGVRQHGRKASLPLSMASVRLWATLAEELGSELEYVRTGNIVLAFDEENAASFERDAAWERDQGLEEVQVLSVRECHELVPGMEARVLAGKYCPTDGVANPMLVTPAFARAGLRLGVRFRLNAPVTGLLQQGSRVCGARIGAEEIEAETVINTAGPWASRFSEQVGCPMPIGPGRSQLLVTERFSRQMVHLWVSVRGWGYMRPTCAGNLVLGSAGSRNDEFSSHVDHPRLAMQAERWRQFFPYFKQVNIIRTFAGITEYTPDGDPYIGDVPGVPGYYVAAGFNGEGFCPGPMVGKILADILTGGEPCVSLEPFRTDRLAEGMRRGIAPPPVSYPWDKMFY